jgi:hypothetical protein
MESFFGLFTLSDPAVWVDVVCLSAENRAARPGGENTAHPPARQPKLFVPPYALCYTHFILMEGFNASKAAMDFFSVRSRSEGSTRDTPPA